MQSFESWLPLAVAIIILSGLAYAVVQQNYRMSANDPQIQIAEDVAQAVSTNRTSPDSIVPPEPTAEIAKSLSTFVVVYSATGTPIGSSVLFDGKMPVVPPGVLEKAKAQGETRVTWQPKPGSRYAVVVDYFGGKEPGYVLAGRSLKEVEIRESQLAMISAVAAAIALLLTFMTIFLLLKSKSGAETSLDPKPAPTQQS